ncbi:MAG: hypothetical protein ACPHK8_04895 [Thermoplasmatota archaeon]
MRFVDLLRDRIRMLREDAMAVAAVMEDAFQDKDSVNDDLLDPELRQMFYDLQDMEVLDIRRSEYEENGRTLRGYEWHVKPQVRATPQVPQAPVLDPVYGALDDSAWARRPQL